MNTKLLAGIFIAATLMLSILYVPAESFAETTPVRTVIGGFSAEMSEVDAVRTGDEMPTINCKNTQDNEILTLWILGKSDVSRTFDAKTVELSSGDLVNIKVKEKGKGNLVAIDLPVKFLVFEHLNNDRILDVKIQLVKMAFCEGVNENFDTDSKKMLLEIEAPIPLSIDPWVSFVEEDSIFHVS